MKRILCTSIALLILLSACSTPVRQVQPSTEPGGDYAYVALTEICFCAIILAFKRDWQGKNLPQISGFTNDLPKLSAELWPKDMGGIPRFPRMRPIAE